MLLAVTHTKVLVIIDKYKRFIFGVEKEKKKEMETLDDLLARVEKGKTPEKTAEEIAAEQAEEQRLKAEADAAEAERLKQEAEKEKGSGEGAEEEGTETQKSFSEILGEAKPAEEKKAEVPAEVLAEIESYKQKVADYEAKLNDPLVKAVTAEATKEQLLAIAAELQGKDYSKSSYKDLLTLEISQITGFEGEELEEQVVEALADFESMPKWKQIAAEKEMQAKFESKAKKGESATLQALEAAYSEKVKTIKTPEQAQKEIQDIEKADKEAISTLGKKVVGQKLYGVEFTENDLKEIVEKDYSFDKANEYLNEKGELNIGSFLEDRFIKKNLAKMIELAEQRGAEKANKGTAVTKTVKQTGVTTTKVNPNEEELKALGLNGVVEMPKSIQWKD